MQLECLVDQIFETQSILLNLNSKYSDPQSTDYNLNIGKSLSRLFGFNVPHSVSFQKYLKKDKLTTE